MEGENQLVSLISGLRALRLVTVGLLFSRVLHFAGLICGATVRPLRVSPAIGQQFKISHSHYSRILYDVYLGLHPYV